MLKKTKLIYNYPYQPYYPDSHSLTEHIQSKRFAECVEPIKSLLILVNQYQQNVKINNGVNLIGSYINEDKDDVDNHYKYTLYVVKTDKQYQVKIGIDAAEPSDLKAVISYTTLNKETIQ
ncbi:hypothetical protein [Flavobacterium muglaense]|uniref:Uncharacterized protein n=1 Tax=Flavobacterium muglaense TaxID=2764716 RepID=A0A923MXF5_9FLAO|nr:hypothetical protein [Flavobacterium muglaense]MBC5836773.1 hypothetical protein [Flavobacterium muglaense]MBC5843277.1 hypothetical protein [Flavobacterium muglaense]